MQRQRTMKGQKTMLPVLIMGSVIILSLVGTCYSESVLPPKNENKTQNFQAPTNSPIVKLFTKPLEVTVASSTKSSTAKESFKTTKALSTESPTSRYSTTKMYTSTKAVVKSARTQKLNSSSRALGKATHSPAHPQERLGAIDCDLALLPRESRLWRGNETHELNLPVTMSEECSGSGGSGGAAPGAADEECPPVIVSWEGSADIQSGDILIVRIADSLIGTVGQLETKNTTVEGTNANNTQPDGERVHRAVLQPAVYQVTRQGHEHCDVSDGMLLDITPLDENGAKIFTLYDKDLNEGANLLIVVSESWRSQCVRLKVTVKSDNCGEAQECSSKGVCYTNVSMEGYECQCCPGYVGAHCEDRDACVPSPCLNNGICVALTQPLNGVNFKCICPYGFAGKKCEKDPCHSSPCLNGGSCMRMTLNGSTTFHCTCSEGWTGTRCDMSTAGGACASNPCVKGICIQNMDNDSKSQGYRCFCQPGYTGDRCEVEYDECDSSPCINGGTCTDLVGGFECSCSRGYNGNTCQLKVDLCSPNPCRDNRDCVDRGNSYTCVCPPGYVGEECHAPPRSACNNNPCAHGGTCWSEADSFYCSCRPGYTGSFCQEDFILESVVGDEDSLELEEPRGRHRNEGGGSVREVHLPLGLYHDRLHNVYIAAGTLGAAIAIVGVVVTACHCRVNKTYSRLLSRLSRVTEPGPPHHWLQDKRAPSASPFPPPTAALDTTDMYYTLDFSDSQSSPLIQ